MTKLNIHPSSVFGQDVIISPSARIGPNCFIEGHTTIGANTVLVGGITLVGDTTIGANCLVEPGVCLTNMFPSAGETSRSLVLGDNISVGAGSVLACGVTIGSNARIAAGTMVFRNVPPHAFVKGNPAAIVGYDTSAPTISAHDYGSKIDAPRLDVSTCAVPGVRLHRFPRIRDLRGDLSVGEFGRNVPFEAKRYFLVFDVPSAETRGEHAHRQCEQFLICVSGQVSVLVDDGEYRAEFDLIGPNIGLYVPPNIWAVQYKYSPGAVLLVFASHFYDPSDYIRSYDQFLAECRRSK